MHLLAMKTVRPTITECRVSAKTVEEEQQFIEEMSPIVRDIHFTSANTNGQVAVEGVAEHVGPRVLLTRQDERVPPPVDRWRSEPMLRRDVDVLRQAHLEEVRHV